MKTQVLAERDGKELRGQIKSDDINVEKTNRLTEKTLMLFRCNPPQYVQKMHFHVKVCGSVLCHTFVHAGTAKRAFHMSEKQDSPRQHNKNGVDDRTRYNSQPSRPSRPGHGSHHIPYPYTLCRFLPAAEMLLS